jgi:hypothetical protein
LYTHVGITLAVLGLGVLAAFVGGAPNPAGGHARAAPDSTAVNESVRPARPTGYRTVEVLHDRVTIHVADTPLRQILEELAQKSGLTLVSRDALLKRITLDVDRLPFDEALGVLLHDCSYALHRVGSMQVGAAAGGDDPARGTTLYVFAARSADFLSERDAGDAVERLGAAALTDTDASVRYQAVDALGEFGEVRAIVLLQQALTDPEIDVREAAIDALGYIGGDESAAALATALNDESALLREEAVAALGNIGGPVASTLLQQAVDEGIHPAGEVLTRLSSESPRGVPVP